MNKKELKNYENLTILITGADGFVASHLCEHMISQKANVIGLVKRNSGGIFKNLDNIKNKMKIKWGDTQDPSIIEEITKKVDVIFHLAAQSHVGYSIHNPYETAFNDYISTLNILEAARKNNVQRIVHAGSSEIYGNPKYVPIDEKHPLNPRSPYAAAKASSENLLQSYFYTYGLPVVMSRFFNIFGPRQGLDQAIPKFILQAINNKKITIYGDGNQTRDYTYVSDAVDAYSSLGIKKRIEGTVVNLGTEKEIKIKDMANLIIKHTSSHSKLVFDKKLRTGETPRLLCNSKKAKKTLGWKSSIDFEKGLMNTIEYYKERKHLVSNLPFML
jgi:UDP-glucose 4-epimerase